MNAFFLGIILGLTITISFGPGSVALFQTTLVRGLIAGFVFATGMLLSDLTLISISYFGLSQLIPKGDYKILGIIAGIILIMMGGISFFRRPLHSMDSQMTPGSQNNKAYLLLRGYFLNIANPFSLIFWIGIVGFAAKNWSLHSQNVFLFFTGIFITAFSTDLLKCYLSGLLRKILASNVILWINKIMGLVFIGIGLFIIYKIQ
jgi:threonine/homoserine/homoserine lactone efflux protein